MSFPWPGSALSAVLLLGILGACSAPGELPDGAVPDSGAADAGAPDGGSPDAGSDGGADSGVRDGGLGHPFGTHGGHFTTGVGFPSNHTAAELDATTATLYDRWKAAYLVPGCVAGQYRVKTIPATSTEFTVSEGHGYGMLLAVLMAGHDPDARRIFDGLYGYYDGHRSANNHELMAWAQSASCANIEGTDSATDGDLDIAYSLLLADRQWGSGGAINYLVEGKRIIAGILAADIHPANSILVGDWATSTDSHYTGTRPSDFTTGHFKAFARATGVTRWNLVVDHTYALVGFLQDHYAASSGLVPDFAIDADGLTPRPAPANWLEGPTDGQYSWNACRVPWRLASDMVLSGDARAQAAVRRIDAWIRAQTGGDPSRIRDGYRLDGGVTGTSPELAFVGPIGVGSMIEPASGSNETWRNALWDFLAAQGASDYFGDSLRLLSMIVMSDNWWEP